MIQLLAVHKPVFPFVQTRNRGNRFTLS